MTFRQLTLPVANHFRHFYGLPQHLLFHRSSDLCSFFDLFNTSSSIDQPFYKHIVDFAYTFPYYSHSQPWFSWTFNKLTYLQVISHPNFCWSVLYLLFSGSLHLQYFMEQLCKFSCPDYSIVAALMNWLQDFIKFSRYIGNSITNLKSSALLRSWLSFSELHVL